MTKTYKFSEIFSFQKKSKIKAGDGSANSMYPFFTSSPVLSKRYDEFQFEDEGLIFGTGGLPSIHFCNEKFSVSTDCLVAQPKIEVKSKFVYYFLLGNIWILEKGFKGAGLKHISKTYISDIQIPLPPLEEQKRIVKELDQADELRQKRKQSVALLDEYLKSVFLEMFGDPVLNEKGWKKVKIKKIGNVITGNTPPRKQKDNYGNYIEWIKSDNINNDYNYVTTAKEYLSKDGIKKGRTAPNGSILVTCIAGSLNCIGNAGMVNRDVSFNQQINAIVPNDDIDQKFLYSQILFSKKTFQKASTNSMKGMLSKSKFEEIEVIKPDIELQRNFSTLFLDVQKLKQFMLSQSEELDTNFNALMQGAFN
jgi:type I restriction enzyme S subunit